MHPQSQQAKVKTVETMRRASRRAAASEQRHVLNRILDEAEEAGGGIGNGALRTKIIRTSSPVPWPVDVQTLRESADGDPVVFKRLVYANEGVRTAPGTSCVCCGHIFSASSPPAAVTVTSAFRDGPVEMFAMRICDSCASCSDNDLLAKAGEVIAREIYPDSDLCTVSPAATVVR
jgi:hypothetical protein